MTTQYLPHTPDGEILPTYSEIFRLDIDALCTLIENHGPAHTRYLLDGVAAGLVEARKWHIESMLKGNSEDYTYYPIGKKGRAYMDANRDRNECIWSAFFMLKKRSWELGRKAREAAFWQKEQEKDEV